MTDSDSFTPAGVMLEQHLQDMVTGDGEIPYRPANPVRLKPGQTRASLCADDIHRGIDASDPTAYAEDTVTWVCLVRFFRKYF